MRHSSGDRVTSTLTRTVTNTWDCSRLGRDVAAGAWWKAPSGKRYYIVAGSRRVIRITLDRRTEQGRTLFSARRRAVTPTVSAVNELGAQVPVLR